MQRFLELVAADLIDRNLDAADLMIVLPSRRSALFMEQYYAKLNGDGWLPRCISMEDFLVELSGVELAGEVPLLLELYEAYVQQEGIHAQGIKDFLKWAPTVLSDFNDIDLYCPNPRDIFNNLTDAKTIETWNPDGAPLTERQQRYLAFWKDLPGVYKHFHHRLDRRQIGFQGSVYRKAINRLKGHPNLFFEVGGCGHVAFAGFNALTQVEQALLDLYKADDRVTIFWDLDPYYYADSKQEAGDYLRKYINRWPKSKVIRSEGMMAQDKQINVHAVASASAQAVLAGQLLSSSHIERPDEVAVVLADESLLLPVLSAIPSMKYPTNVTMGYPLKWSPGPQLVKAILRLQDSASGKGEMRRFYYKHLFDVLNSPALGEFPQALALKNKLEELHWLYPVGGDMLELIQSDHPWFELLLNDWSDLSQMELIQRISELILYLMQSENTAETHGEGLVAVLEILDQLRWHFDQYQVQFEYSLFRALLSQLIDQVKLPFSGEPLSGLQIMGMLESRSLDFQRLIVLSVNEGTLPGGRAQVSLIPPDIRKGHGLPNHSEKDKVFAYHFYRLIQRAQQVDLIYDSRQEGVQSGEPSRYILQLQMEWAEKMPWGSFKSANIALPASAPESEKGIRKDEATLEMLKEYITKGISPSGINRYLDCPLDFYYQYIIGIRDEVGMEEDPEASTLGTLSHSVLELLYQPYVNQQLIPQLIDRMIPQVEPLLTTEFENHFPKGGWKKGRPFIAFTAAKQEIEHLLKLDRELLENAQKRGDEVVLLGVETKASMKITCGEIEATVRGIVDRVQRVGNTIEVLDYKSGKVKSSDVSLKKLDELLGGTAKPKALQLLCYACFAWEEFGKEGMDIRSANLTFKNHQEAMTLKVEGATELSPTHLEEFKSILGEVLSQILDDNLLFEHNSKSKYCLLCE